MSEQSTQDAWIEADPWDGDWEALADALNEDAPGALKRLRLALGWSQPQLAERLGVSASTICRRETGEYPQFDPLPVLLLWREAQAWPREAAHGPDPYAGDVRALRADLEHDARGALQRLLDAGLITRSGVAARARLTLPVITQWLNGRRPVPTHHHEAIISAWCAGVRGLAAA